MVPGGGTALLYATKGLQLTAPNQDQGIGANVVVNSLAAPLRQMAINAGLSPDIAEKEVKIAMGADDGVFRGLNFANSSLVDMYSEGIIDPVLVTITALRNAVSVSSSLINTNYAIVQE